MKQRWCLTKKLWWWPNKLTAFTLLEALLALLMLGGICSIFSAVITHNLAVKENLAQTPTKEWENFLIQLQRETTGYTLEKITSMRITLKRSTQGKDSDVSEEDPYIYIERYEDVIRKRKKNGYQPLLFD